MLNSIKIQNYRNLKQLSIEKLGHVNLIIGKNNTGKTSLLEALYLFTSQDETDVIPKIILSRGENHVFDSNGTESDKILATINSIFWKRNEGGLSTIKIESANQYLRLLLKNMPTSDEILGEKIPSRYFMLEVSRNEFASARHILLRKAITDLEYFPPIGDGVLNPKNTKYVRSTLASFTNSNQLATYLDSISLGDNYGDVIKALQIVDKDIERVAFLTDSASGERFPVARLKNNKLISLLSMGDGINRILTIILAMVNCQNGYLLLDEFENGLHYSVQEKLWEIIFNLAEQLHIQVFVTTHSNDTIRAFENIVNQNESNPLNGLLIKLESIDDNIESMFFEPDELKVITENLIEVRR